MHVDIIQGWDVKLGELTLKAVACARSVKTDVLGWVVVLSL